MIYRFRKQLKRKKNSFTLVEVLVAISLLSVIILGVSRIYLNVMDSQDTISQENYVQSDLEYFLRILANNAREAEEGNGSLCSVPAGEFFYQSQPFNITFIKNGSCFSFRLQDGALLFSNGEAGVVDQAISSSQTTLLDLKFIIHNEVAYQPLLTVLVKAAPASDPNHPLLIQSSLSLNTELK